MLGPYKDIEIYSKVGRYLHKSPTHAQRECLRNFLAKAKHTSVPNNKYKEIKSKDSLYAVTDCEHIMTIFVRKDQNGDQHWKIYELKVTVKDSCSG